MTGFRQYVLVGGLVLLLSGTVELAQSTEAGASVPYIGWWQVYTNTNGVYDLVAMDAGYTWAATSGGVACYNTSEQITFTTADGLATNGARAVAVDGQGRPWFATGGGVSVLDHGGTPFDRTDDAWATFTTTDGLVDDSVWIIEVDDLGWLWFGTDSGVSVLDHGGTPFDKADDAWATFTTVDGLADNSVFAIAAADADQLWFGTDRDVGPGGVSVLDYGGTPFDKGDDTWATFTSEDGLADNDVSAIAIDGAGRLWFAADSLIGLGGVSVLDDGDTPFDKTDDTWTTFTSADGLADNSVSAVVIDGAGQLWFGARGGGLSVLDNGGTPFDKTDDTWATFTSDDGLAENWVFAIAVDGLGCLWLGTNNGASVLDHGGTPFDKADDSWATLTAANGLADNVVDSIALDSAGRLWFGTMGGMSVLDDGGTPFDKSDDAWGTFTAADGLAGDGVYAVAVNSAGQLWFGTAEGVSVLDYGSTPFDKGDDAWATFTSDDGMASNSVHAIAVDGAGRLWFGTWGGGVSVLDDGGTPFDKGDDVWATFTADDGLADDWVFAIAMDSTGQPWFGTKEGGVSVLNDGGTLFDKNDDVWAAFTADDGLMNDWVFAIAMDRTGRLWFGTMGRVSVLDHNGTPFDKDDDAWATFTADDGLADRSVYAITADRDGRLWFGTRGGGVSVLDYGSTLFDKTDDAWATFTTADGLAGNDVAAIAVDGAGRLWFGTYGGVAELVLVTYRVHLPTVRRTWQPYYEDNDDWLNAYGPLACGRAYQAYAGDIDDYYYFRLAEGSTVSVSVEDFAPTSSYGTVVLYGPAVGDERGDYISHYGLPGERSMSLGPHSLKPGKYYVRVYTAEQHSTTQLYRLTVHCSPSAPALSLNWP